MTIQTAEAAIIAIANYLQDNSVPVYMTPKQVAESLQIHPDTVRKLAREGKIHSYKIGDERRFTPAAIREYVATLQSQ
jgi:excisionase family DNA binding protein